MDQSGVGWGVSPRFLKRRIFGKETEYRGLLFFLLVFNIWWAATGAQSLANYNFALVKDRHAGGGGSAKTTSLQVQLCPD